MFKKLEGHNVLFRATAVSADQMKLVEEIVAHFEGRTVLSRKECRDAHGVLRGKKAAPYFISKNVACKVKGQHGMYDLSRLKLRAGSELTPAETEATADAPPATKKAPKKAKGKREAAPKKEAKGRKGQKQIEAPSETPDAPALQPVGGDFAPAETE